MGQAQGFLSAGPLGPRITFVQSDPINYFKTSPSSSAKFDVAVFVISLWYFSNPTKIAETFAVLQAHAKRIVIAEYALHATNPRATPHVLAALTQASLEVRKTNSNSNVRTVVGPRAIKELAGASGLTLESEGTVVPEDGLQDGMWETTFVVGGSYDKEIDDVIGDEREKSLVLALRDATVAAASVLDGGARKTQTMDV